MGLTQMVYGSSISCHFHDGVLFHETFDQLLSQQVVIKIKILKNWGLGKSEHVYWTILDSMPHSWMFSSLCISYHIPPFVWLPIHTWIMLDWGFRCFHFFESPCLLLPPEGPPDGPPGSPTLARSHWNSQAGATARTLAVAAAFHWFRVGKIYGKPSKI